MGQQICQRTNFYYAHYHFGMNLINIFTSNNLFDIFLNEFAKHLMKEKMQNIINKINSQNILYLGRNVYNRTFYLISFLF